MQKLVNDWQVRNGWVHHRLCRLYAIKGQKELANQALEEATSRAGDPGTLQHVDRLKTWLKEYSANEEEAKELKEAKGADARWKLIRLYRESYPMRLDEFIALIQFRETYPKDPRAATSGDCDWRLMEVMMVYGIADEAMKLAEKFREKFPKSGITTYGDPLWRLGEWSGWLGRGQDSVNYYRELREKHPKHWASERGEAAWRIGEACMGLKRWQEALDAFKEVRDKYKDHWTNHPPPGQQARIQERIFEATKNGAR